VRADRFISALACAVSIVAAARTAAAQPAGLAPDWEVRKSVAALADHLKPFKAILDQAQPQTWEGVPTAYMEQAKRINTELDYLTISAQALAAKPDKLSAALTAYFRMQSLDLMMRSYAEGIRRFQNSALAELLLAEVSTVAADRDKLRQYIVDLAVDKEQELRVADEEAQRCRAFLSRQPAGAAKSDSRVKKKEDNQ